MSGAVVGLAGAGGVYLAVRTGFRWAGRRCDRALLEASCIRTPTTGSPSSW